MKIAEYAVIKHRKTDYCKMKNMACQIYYVCRNLKNRFGEGGQYMFIRSKYLDLIKSINST